MSSLRACVQSLICFNISNCEDTGPQFVGTACLIISGTLNPQLYQQLELKIEQCVSWFMWSWVSCLIMLSKPKKQGSKRRKRTMIWHNILHDGVQCPLAALKPPIKLPAEVKQRLFKECLADTWTHGGQWTHCRTLHQEDPLSNNEPNDVTAQSWVSCRGCNH